MRPFLIGVACVLLLLLGLNFGLPLVFSDQSSPPRANLEPLLKTMPKTDNALTFFSQAAEKFDIRGIEPRMFLTPANWVQSEASRLVTENAAAISLFEQGVAKGQSLSHARDPQYSTFDAINVEALPRDVKSWHQIGELVLIRANLHLLIGDAKSAWQDYFLVWKAANLIRNANGSLLELDVGDSLTQLALTQMRGAMRQSKLTDQAWRDLLAQLQAAPPSRTALEESLKSERRFFRLALDAASGKTSSTTLQVAVSSPLVRFIPKGYALQSGKTLETYTAWLEGILKRSRNCPEAISAEPPAAPAFLDTNPFVANSIGNALLTSWIPPYGLATRACKLEQAYRVTQISLALHATALLTDGVPPANIGVLEGRYFDKLPLDPFSAAGKAFAWDINGKILRSEDGTGYSVDF